MGQVTEAGAVVFPASPAFWHKPKTIEELVDSLVDRMLTHLKVKPKAEIEWQGEE
jgi:4-hydroxy-3-polyprenylbenzoate decarboxylase